MVRRKPAGIPRLQAGDEVRPPFQVNLAEDLARVFHDTVGVFPIANLRDIIASKKASGRQKDRNEMPLLESFREEYEKRHAPALRSALDIAAKRPIQAADPEQ